MARPKPASATARNLAADHTEALEQAVEHAAAPSPGDTVSKGGGRGTTLQRGN
jgi:hypothetical protein